jgi:UDP-N-acetylmuramate--alanine ligase
VRKRLFFIGIGGSGLSAIARLMFEKGFSVSGSDRIISDQALELRDLGITVYEGHSTDHIIGSDVIIRSSAIPDTNVEVLAAHQAGIPVLKRAEFLGTVMAQHIGIGIAGTHGKTTTTAMISWMLAAMDEDPSYIIGGVSKNLGNNAHAGHGKFFIIEADEYDRMFLGLQPTVAVITSIEHDHPDCYPTEMDYQQAFLAFSKKVDPQGFVVVCGDNPGIQKIIPLINNVHLLTYGIENNVDFQAINIETNAFGGYSFDVIHHGLSSDQFLCRSHLSVPGLHNVLNAMAAIVIAFRYHLDLNRCVKVLQQFSGTGRRFDVLGEVNGITIVDDYAHHPTEIKATLEAARSRYKDRPIWVVWQPHTFSRTKTLFDEFTKAFTKADHVIVSEIYAARESNDGFSSSSVVSAMNHPDVNFIATIPQISNFLLNNLKPDDILLVLSAGDADLISKNVYKSLIQKEVSE